VTTVNFRQQAFLVAEVIGDECNIHAGSGGKLADRYCPKSFLSKQAFSGPQ
jgi:hypothetical protein